MFRRNLRRVLAGVVWSLALVVLTMTGVGTVGGEEPGKAQRDTMADIPDVVSVDDMWLQCELWAAAMEAGNVETAEQYEKTLKAMITADIALSQYRVRELAETVVVNADASAEKSSASTGDKVDNDKPAGDTAAADNGDNGSHDGNGENDTSARSDAFEAREAFRTSLTSLNTKEALWLALERTEDVANKYRLLGDYINLLRRELKMSRLHWAAVARNAADREDRNEHRTSTQGPSH
ncbi:hypothetical protein GF377_00220 [candidate division GN15 bacterium]|nr:hypothetical protein [candidate division GN15 bacterium]